MQRLGNHQVIDEEVAVESSIADLMAGFSMDTTPDAHVYPVAGPGKSACWSCAVANGRIIVNAREDGFRVWSDSD